jgi:hypothetical protein
MPYDLEFEKPLAELEKKIVALQNKRDLYWLLRISVPK